MESPTPTEFVQYIIDTSQKIGSENMDNHIRPLWSSCPFCAIDFDIIGQLEDYEEDEKFIVEKLNLNCIKMLLQGKKAGAKKEMNSSVKYQQN